MGIHEFEKRTRQRIMVNVDLYLEPDARIERDHISETVDYDFLRREIAALADSGHFHLQETFCERILAICLASRGGGGAGVQREAGRVSRLRIDRFRDFPREAGINDDIAETGLRRQQARSGCAARSAKPLPTST
jgi:hypothetical protein